ncbi:hypothetical protein [Peribacillus huizhouensis]|uniref:WD40 repeat domain-containing protein n=1 Tax=Peribacillus huizhouensis TaxID=1501239 RepID=A0ABR6CWB6_9BACI|nr:hypothetical protein [Peribacillus huizhouensis]MBA9029302.1 hypothetical protein [Peribacillus huizhouensis]
MFGMEILKEYKKSYVLGISNNKKWTVSSIASKTVIYDSKTNQEIKVINFKNVGNVLFSDDDKYLILKNTSGTSWIFETSDFELVKKFITSKKNQLKEGNICLTSENDVLVDIVSTDNGDQIVLLNINKGKIDYFSHNDETRIILNQYIKATNTHIFTLFNNVKGNKILKVEDICNYPIMEEITIGIWSSVLFDHLNNNYIILSLDTLLIMDSERNTKEKEINLPINQESGYFTQMNISNNGKYLIVSYSSHIMIFETSNYNLLRSDFLYFVLNATFSSDDSILLITSAKKGYLLENNL